MWLKFDELVLIYIGYRIQITEAAKKVADDNTMCNTNNVTDTFNYGSDWFDLSTIMQNNRRKRQQGATATRSKIIRL